MKWYLLIPVAIVWMVYSAIASYFDRPTVLRDPLSGDCVEIVQPSDQHYTCDNLPPKYVCAYKY